jgi:hypothetical protein
VKDGDNLTGRDHSKELGLVAKIILEWILGKQSENCGVDFIRLKIGTSGGLL